MTSSKTKQKRLTQGTRLWAIKRQVKSHGDAMRAKQYSAKLLLLQQPARALFTGIGQAGAYRLEQRTSLMGGVECCFLRAPAAPLLASAGCLLGLPSGVCNLPFLRAWSVLLSGTASTMSCKGRPMLFNSLPAGSKAQHQGLSRQHELLRLIAFQCLCAVHGVHGP